MADEGQLRAEACVRKAQAELAGLAGRGLVMAGNAFSSVLFAKGDLSEAEREGASLLSGPDGKALRASLAALGYPPEDWCALSTVLADGGAAPSGLLREAVCALDPATLVACDETAAQALRETYADELAGLEDMHEAMLEPGVVAHVLGMRVMDLGGFEAALGNARQKQVMWARLKLLRPLGEPY